MKERLWDFFRLSLVAALLFATTCCFLASTHWFPELFSHFRIQLVLLACVIIGLAIPLKRKISLTLACACLLTHLFVLITTWEGFRPVRDSNQAQLRVISYNLLISNNNYETVLSWLSEQNADLVILVEVSHQWKKALEPLKERYPHRAIQLRDFDARIAILSKFPLTIDRHQSDPPVTLKTEIIWQDQAIQVLANHPQPPLGPRYADIRNRTLSHIAEMSQQSKQPFLAAGDFNCTPWSPEFRPIRNSLQSSSRHSPFALTWNRFIPPFAIPIDHILHNDQFLCLKHSIGPAMGSDHAPILATFVLNPDFQP